MGAAFRKATTVNISLDKSPQNVLENQKRLGL